MLKDGIPFNYRDQHPEFFTDEFMRRMIEEATKREAELLNQEHDQQPGD